MIVTLKEYNNYRNITINRLINYSRKKLNKYSAEDIFQDGFILFKKEFTPRGTKGRIKFDDEKSLKSYIYTICKRHYLNNYGTKSTHNSIYIDNKRKPLSLSELGDKTKYKLVSHIDLIDFYITEAKNLLNPTEYKLIKLHIAGFKFSEIARRVDIRADYIDLMLKDVKKKLNKII